MTLLIVPMPGNESLATSLAHHLHGHLDELETRVFPDGETYLRFRQDLRGSSVILVCTLDHPNPKFLPLLTSTSFARRLSLAFDELVTVDPHLHRHRNLAELYSIRTAVVHSAPLIAEWIVRNEARAVLIGPDVESEQWVSEVATLARAPYRVLRKERLGDRDVKITVPDLHDVKDRTPVLIDDIVSSGRTMIETARQLRREGLSAAVCIAVHALFSQETENALREVSGRLVTTNSVPHATNEIDLSASIAERYVQLAR